MVVLSHLIIKLIRFAQLSADNIYRHHLPPTYTYYEYTYASKIPAFSARRSRRRSNNKYVGGRHIVFAHRSPPPSPHTRPLLAA